MLFTDAFFPKNFEEFIGNPELVEKAKAWAEAWQKGKKQKPLLLYGATGTGKTCLALLIAKMFEWQLFELNASDLRSKEIIEKFVSAAVQNASFSGRPRLVLLDEADGLQARDRGGAGAITKILRESSNPVILTANDIYADQKFAPIRSECELLQFKKINYLSIAKRLREICSLKGISFDEEAVKELAKNCAGDFRSALLDVQALSLSGEISKESLQSLGYRARQENIFNTIEKIFKAKNIQESREARFKSEISEDMLLRWIEENIPRHFTEAGDMANAFNALSRADIFEGRIFNRQHYGFKAYSSELMTSGVSLCRSKDYHGWIQYQFPSLLRKLSSGKGTRELKKSLGKKIGEQTHSGSREFIANDLFFFKIFFAKKPVEFSASFDLNEKEIAFLLSTKPETKKVQKIFSEAKEKRQKEFALKRRPLQALGEKELEKIEKKLPSDEDILEEEEKKSFEEESSKQAKLF